MVEVDVISGGIIDVTVTPTSFDISSASTAASRCSTFSAWTLLLVLMVKLTTSDDDCRLRRRLRRASLTVMTMSFGLAPVTEAMYALSSASVLDDSYTERETPSVTW